MNPVQRTMITGSFDAGCLERTADCCMYLPAQLWREENVEVIGGIDNRAFHSTGRGSLSRCCYYGVCLPKYTIRALDEMDDADDEGAGLICLCSLAGSAITLVGYAITSLLAAPCLATGMCCKHIALECDGDAARYHKEAISYLQTKSSVESIIVPENEKDEVVYLKKKIDRHRSTLNDNELKIQELSMKIEALSTAKVTVDDPSDLGLKNDILEKGVKDQIADLTKNKNELEINSKHLNSELKRMEKQFVDKENFTKSNRYLNSATYNNKNDILFLNSKIELSISTLKDYALKIEALDKKAEALNFIKVTVEDPDDLHLEEDILERGVKDQLLQIAKERQALVDESKRINAELKLMERQLADKEALKEQI
jgi:hypothetical protein